MGLRKRSTTDRGSDEVPEDGDPLAKLASDAADSLFLSWKTMALGISILLRYNGTVAPNVEEIIKTSLRKY